MIKVFFSVALVLLGIIANAQQQAQNQFKITTFNNIPKDMEGCGEELFLNKQDARAKRFVFLTDYYRALICINHKMILLKNSDKSSNKNNSIFSNQDYILIIKYVKEQQIGDENYHIKSAIINLKYHSKVVWKKSAIGEGGC